jgi:sugar O-acyltransferase (sialic acid O-acetyltransferase NeuD family)
MMKILIIGAGGHAGVVADALLMARDAGELVDPVGYLDDAPALVGISVLGLPVLGPIAARNAVRHDAVIVAIGNNADRRRLFEELRQAGETFAIARHPSAVIGRNVSIGEGTMICAGAIVNCGSVVGSNVILNTGCSVDHDGRIGDHVHIAPGVRLGGNVTIGAGTLVGIGSAVMPGRTVGEWSTVGAGALVHGDVNPRCVVVGIPARSIVTCDSRNES